jgi:beta-lactamase class A
MAQYGNSQNPPNPRFQRYGSPAQAASGGYPSPNGAGQPPSDASAPQGYGNGGASPAQNELGQGSGTWDVANEPSRLVGPARRRNQWRQHQRLTPDFGVQAVPPQPLPAQPLSREASLPKLQPLPSPTADGQTRPPQQPASAPRPVSPQERSFNLRRPSPAPTAPAGREAGLPAGSSRPARPAGVPPIQPHPHSTYGSPQLGTINSLGSPTTTRPPTKGRMAKPGGLGQTGGPAPVTPLRPRSRRQQGEVGANPNEVGALDQSPPVNEPRSRARGPLQKRFGKPPLPVLYLIRLVILGVGVAAIAGTLLSVLSPSNVVSSQDDSAPAATAREANPATSGSLLKSSGNNGGTIDDIALTSELTRLKTEIEQLVTLTPGLTQSVFLVDLDAGRYVDIESSVAVPAASTIKVPILVAFLQQVDAGQIALNQALTLQENQVAGGSGTMQNDAVGTQYSALDVVTRMIVTSDNTATNMIVDALGGASAVNQAFEEWGLQSTVLRNPLPDLEGTNTTSVRDLALLMALVDQGALLSGRSRDRMFSIMQRTVNRSLIPFSITDDSVVANKTGDLAGTLGDVALVDAPNGKRYVLAALVQRPNNDGRASELIRRIAETTHTEMNQPISPIGAPTGSNQTEDDLQVETTPAGEAVPVPDYRGLEVEPVPPDPVPAEELETPVDEFEEPPSRNDIPQG